MATLAEVAEHITHVIGSGTDQTRKALIETPIAEIKITGPRHHRAGLPHPRPHADGAAKATADTHEALTSENKPVRAPKGGVRAMTNLVEVPGIEPGSSVASPRLLRAQFAMPLLGSPGLAN